MAHVARERVDQIQDPELSIEQAMKDYKRLGYSDNWINGEKDSFKGPVFERVKGSFWMGLYTERQKR